MALRQLMLTKKIDQRKKALEELLRDNEGLKTRSEELEAALEEAKTDEEIAAVDEEITKLDADQANFDEKKGVLEGEIADLEGELEQLNSKAPSNNQRTAEPETEKRTILGTGGIMKMIERGFFKGFSHEQRNALIAREEVQEFLQRTREFGTQERSVTNAELLIPDVLLGILRDNLHRYSKLISKVYLRNVPGTTRTNIAGEIPEGIWTEACAKLNELTISFSQIETDGYKVGGYIAICNATLQDSDVNLISEIMDNISQAIGLALDKATLYGTGKKMPVGIVTRLAETTQPPYWGTKAPTWTDLHQSNLKKITYEGSTAEAFFSALILALGTVKANYSTGQKFWAMNSNTFAKIQAKALSINAAGAIVSGMNMTMPVVGGDVTILEFIPDNDIIGGYGSLYLLAEREGINLSQSEHVQFIEDNTVFKGIARYDGRPIFGEGFVAVNINNQDPTTAMTFAPDISNPEDAYLSSLAIGSLTLSPAFSRAIGEYTAATTNASNTVTATAAKTGASVTIKVNNVTQESGASATWTAGENTVEITVKYGTTTKVYTVIVTKS